MKKLYFLLLMMVSLSSTAAFADNYMRPSGNAVIFVEHGVEFAIFPDGQFDFFFNPRGDFRNVPGHINYSYNSGYNYRPFIQLDDYGAVVQIESVPVYYDYYGRISHAGNVNIRYDAFGLVSRIGRMYVHYDAYGRISHTSGYINRLNRRYVQRPWHNNYIQPYSNVAIVYNQPYRMHYNPSRLNYNTYRNHYDLNRGNTYIQNNFYRPGDQITAYHKGYREETPRNIRIDKSNANRNSGNSQNVNRGRENYRDNNSSREVRSNNATSRNQNIRNSKASEKVEVNQSRSSRRKDASNSVQRQPLPSRKASEPQVRTNQKTIPQAEKAETKSNSGSRSSRGNQ